MAELTANAFHISSLRAHAATLWKAGMEKIAVFKSMLHGLTRGVISKLRGGRFMSGFASGLSSMFDVGTQGHGGFVGRTVIMAVVGGTAAVIGGGKFANGALAGAFMHMFNAENIIQRIKAFLQEVEARAQMYKAEYSNSINSLINKGGAALSAIVSTKHANILHKGYPVGFAKDIYTGKGGAILKILRTGRYPLTTALRSLPAVRGAMAYELGNEATFYFKAYVDTWNKQ